ncbi:partner of Y14 and mago-like isoform X2 [Iris pallida]|uniref:Partner of Y14 and mago-like isoform X2 n=1 Tax=Iris pallida TaxID=29817 RepID=A0AAX6I4S2_IRIPA|nr:partner of Y14 and mago-like isoform X2 [Iris pallida]
MGEEESSVSRPMKNPKEGERILAPTRRPDGTLRKPVRIRAGYVPQDEVAIYQSKGALLKKEAQPEVPPGYDPVLDAAASAAAAGKPKTKSAKRNERKKEKKQLQAAMASLSDKGKDLDSEQAESLTSEAPAETLNRLQSVETVTSQISNLSFSATPVVAGPSTDQIETTKPEESAPDIDKRIRALKKKIRLAEAQLKGDQQDMKPEHAEKTAKIEGWKGELKALEDKKANPVS